MIMWLFIFTIILNTLNIHYSPIREYFTAQKKLILVGDSIFKNNNYVPISVEDTIRKRYPNAIILAKDNSVIADAKNQISLIGEELDEPSTYIYISVGGNDILNHYQYSPKSNHEKLNSIYHKYTNMINSLPFKKAHIILSSIYYPPTHKKYYPLIDNWNNRIKELCNKKGYELLPVHKYMKYDHHFTHDIEPSISGSRIIANTIFRNLNP